jgi:L-arabinose isomerase
MLKIADYEFWFVAGSQFLYGEEQLKSVAKDAQDIVDKLNASGNLPYPIVFKGVMTTAEGITQFMKDANYNDKVAGVITWMHTFSPAKNWIRGTRLLQKPLLHLATQYLNNIPYDTIDFDYMNLNQSAHGDREYAYINARLNKGNKIVYGYWGDEEVQQEIADWQMVAVAYNESFKLKIVRFGDTMRNVAVTEGDKVEAEIRLGWTVDYWPVSDLVEYVDAVDEKDIDAEYKKLEEQYEMVEGDNDHEKYVESVRYQLREYLAIKKFMDDKGYTAFTTNFEDLHGLKQLPGLASQMLMRDGYGFGAEGDWKTAGWIGCSRFCPTMKRRPLWKTTRWICVMVTKLSLARTCWKLTQPSLLISRALKYTHWTSVVRMTQLDWYLPVRKARPLTLRSPTSVMATRSSVTALTATSQKRKRHICQLPSNYGRQRLVYVMELNSGCMPVAVTTRS